MELNFAKAFSQLRKSASISQVELAKKLNVSQSLISSFEHGTREPSLPMLCRICETFDVSADYLLGRSDSLTKIGESSHALALFDDAIFNEKSQTAKEYAKSYLDCAARIITRKLENFEDIEFISKQAMEMTKNEYLLQKEKQEQALFKEMQT